MDEVFDVIQDWRADKIDPGLVVDLTEPGSETGTSVSPVSSLQPR